MPPAISQSKLNIILHGLDSRHSYPKIAFDAKVSTGTVSKVRIAHRPGLKMSTGGRPRKLSATQARYAVRLVTCGNTISVSKATQKLCELTGQVIHPKTIRRVLRDAGMRATKGAKSTKESKVAKRGWKVSGNLLRVHER